MDLTDQHLAELHQRARELGRAEVPDADARRADRGDRVGRRARGDGGGREEAVDAGLERPRREPERQARGRRRREPEQDGPEEDGEEEAEPETEEVSGVLDRMPQGYGFLRLGGLREATGDVYVSASQIRRCELRPGDEVSGPARPPRRGERHRALVRIESVNGQSPEEERRHFEDLTPAPPQSAHVPAGRRAGPAGARRRPARPACLRPAGARPRPAPLGADDASSRPRARRSPRPTPTSACWSPTSGPRRSRSGSRRFRRPRSSPPPPTRSRVSRSERPSWRWATPSASPRPARTSSS